MTIIQIIQLIATLAGATKDIQGIVDDLHASGHSPTAPIPEVHMERIKEILAQIPSNPLGDPDGPE